VSDASEKGVRKSLLGSNGMTCHRENLVGTSKTIECNFLLCQAPCPKMFFLNKQSSVLTWSIKYNLSPFLDCLKWLRKVTVTPRFCYGLCHCLAVFSLVGHLNSMILFPYL